MRHKGLTVLTLMIALLCSARVSNGQTLSEPITLDDGVTTVTVTTTAVTWSIAEITALVVWADRSTKDDCNTTTPIKGFFEAGDRVFLATKYLAWLGRGRIRGLWTVDPSHGAMKYTAEAMQRHFILTIKGFNPPVGEVYQAVESPKGELGYYIVSQGDAAPFRLRIRAPSFINLACLPVMALGGMVADTIALIGTIDIVLGEVDR